MSGDTASSARGSALGTEHGLDFSDMSLVMTPTDSLAG